MKKILLSFSLTLILTYQVFAVRHTVANAGNTYTPSNISITLGDTVDFVITAAHNAVEVSQATWGSNGSTSNGGFNIPYGGGTWVPQSTGTFFYVCTPHAAMGMKGIITVVSSGLNTENLTNNVNVLLYPNPVVNTLYIQSENENTVESVELIDISGKLVQSIQYGTDFGQRKVDVTSMPNGVYMVRVKSGKAVLTKRVLINK
jgi:plastocyanin